MADHQYNSLFFLSNLIAIWGKAKNVSINSDLTLFNRQIASQWTGLKIGTQISTVRHTKNMVSNLILCPPKNQGLICSLSLNRGTCLVHLLIKVKTDQRTRIYFKQLDCVFVFSLLLHWRLFYTRSYSFMINLVITIIFSLPIIAFSYKYSETETYLQHCLQYYKAKISCLNQKIIVSTQIFVSMHILKTCKLLQSVQPCFKHITVLIVSSSY